MFQLLQNTQRESLRGPLILKQTAQCCVYLHWGSDCVRRWSEARVVFIMKAEGQKCWPAAVLILGELLGFGRRAECVVAAAAVCKQLMSW